MKEQWDRLLQSNNGSNEILKELRKAINRNADNCKKELEIISRSQEKLENSFAEMKPELKAMNSRLHNEELIFWKIE